MRSLLVFCAALALSVGAHATEIAGQVVAVSEGDTLVFQDRNQRDYKVRLAGIDAPEILQAFGRKSRFSLKDMVFLKPARSGWYGTRARRCGRDVGACLCRRYRCGPGASGTGHGVGARCRQ